MRYQVPGLKNGIDITTTPEGFKFAHKLFVTELALKPELKATYGMIQASTYENEANLPDDYIQTLLDSYPPELIQAYLNGEFTNLTSGTVYRSYDRKANRSKEYMLPYEPLFIGMDFNVDHMAATVYVQRSNGFHAVDELKDIFDTPAMIKTIQEKYQSDIKSVHKLIYVYPDSSGKNRKSNDASITDITLLKSAGFQLRYKSTNPFVKDRVAATNKAFADGWLHINDTLCPTVATNFEQQAYDDNGEPDKKTGMDHQCFSGDTLVETENGIQEISKINKTGLIRSFGGIMAPYHSAQKIGTNQEMVMVVFSDGRFEKCTHDHEFLTVEGWINAIDLKGKKLYYNQKYKNNLNDVIVSQNQKPNTARQNIARTNADQKSPGGLTVKNIIKIPNDDVYCLTVPDIGCFALASGVIVSNCDASTYPIAYERPIKRIYVGASKSAKTLKGYWE
jgi:hypothetical protein